MPPGEKKQRYTLYIILLTSFLVPFMGSAVNLAIPAIGSFFHIDSFLLSWVMIGYLLASAAFLLPFGRLADLFGRRPFFLWGVAVFTLATLLCGSAWSIESLLLFRFIQGVGSAAIFSTGMAILTLAFSPQERGKILGFNAATVYLGLSVGPVLGGILNQQLGWQSIFLFAGLLSLPVAILAFRMLHTVPVETGAEERFDWLSACLYSVGLGALMFGLSAFTAQGVIGQIAQGAAPVGAALLIAFIIRQARARQPMIDIKLFSGNKVFAYSNLAALINYSATAAVGYILAIHLQVVMGFNSQISGLIMLSQPVLMALLSPFAGALSDRISPQTVSAWGMGLTTLGLGSLIFIAPTTPIWLIVAKLAFLGVGFALFASPNNNAIMSSVDRQHFGIAGSTLGTTRLVGQTASMALATLIVVSFIGSTPLDAADPERLIKSFQTAFGIFTATCFCGVFAALARNKKKPEAR